MRERLRVAIRGAVQGVGFRPFVFRLARDLDLDGWVLNSPQGVLVEVEGEHERLERCLRRLSDELPPRSVIHGLESTWLDPVPYAGFAIRESRHDGAAIALVLPDIATCDACRAELFEAGNRRYRYPFTNCTNCGPRFSIIHSMPYDRARTSMRGFTMCPACEREYHDPGDRRFHAQPNACPVCGPQLALWDGDGRGLAARDEALLEAAAAVRAGQIVAVKGLGGFQLLVDAANHQAVARLRLRKHREEKPFALMYGRLAEVGAACEVSEAEARLLTAPEAPIVLLRRRSMGEGGVAPEVAPGNPYLGVMLPCTPLHHLLLAEIGRPVVATSGNVSDEPMCIDEREALTRLAGVADVFLVHDRPIVRHVDDSIVRVMLGRELVTRRARGYAPLPVRLREVAPPIVAVGGHLKNTVAMTAGANVFISQHIGDLESQPSNDAFLEVLSSLESLYQVTPIAVAADLHPDYASTRYARALNLPLAQVQHHFAHVASCMAENDLDGPVLGVSWDGTGYGTDGTVWGGEFLRTTGDGFDRIGCLRPFRLPGGERAIREPRRSAMGVLYAMMGARLEESDVLSEAFTPAERRLLLRALSRGVNAPVTTSAGRLFDAVASLAGLRQQTSFEGQAALELECAVDEPEAGRYAFEITRDGARLAPVEGWAAPDHVADWEPMIREILADADRGVRPGVIAARLHTTLADIIVEMAVRAGEPRVVLTGGCFQNRVLTERAVGGLRRAGFAPYWHQRVPPNDGGLSLGQIAACLRPGVMTKLGLTPQPAGAVKWMEAGMSSNPSSLHAW